MEIDDVIPPIRQRCHVLGRSSSHYIWSLTKDIASRFPSDVRVVRCQPAALPQIQSSKMRPHKKNPYHRGRILSLQGIVPSEVVIIL